ncbi:MAG: signal peptide peptidase SppA [bacterium]|jgi:protease IV
MNQFIKFMFASFLGTLITFLVLFLVFFAMIAGIVAMAESDEVEIKENTVLYINWQEPILDRGSDNPFEGFDFATMESKKPLGLNDILRNLEKAAEDPNISGIFLNMEFIPTGGTTIGEIRDKLEEFKESGKFIISYANNYDQGAYYLASLADEIYLHPDGMIMFKGLNLQVMFLKGLLDKLEIEAQVVRGPDNKYKSAVEPLMLEKMSEANREQLSVLANSIWGRILLALSKSRGISIEDLNNIADNLDLTQADNAVSLNFADGLLHYDEVLDLLKEKTGIEKEDDLEWVSFNKYINVKPADKPTTSRNRIAVVYAQGSIVPGKGGPMEIGGRSMAKAIREARTSDRVKAMVFRVNSGGGDAQASEEIRREIALAAEKMPVIVSMGDVAASGGYWISTNADYIFAHPTTITGSIGVFGVIPNFKDMFNNKLGITFEEVMTNKNSDFIDVMKPMPEYQHEKLNQIIIDIYDEFIALVATTRELDPGFVDGIARGRVWSGTDAMELGLIDELGGLEDAIAHAAEEADLGEDYKISNYPVRKPFFEQLVEEIMGNAQTRMVEQELGDFKPYYDQLKAIRKMEGVQARLPFIYTMN